jgi:hypothetical protein
MAAAAMFGFLASIAIATFAELAPEPFAALGCVVALCAAAFFMRDRAAWQPAPYLKYALAGGAAAAILAGFASFAIPDRYVAAATMRAYVQNAYGLAVPNTSGALPGRLIEIQQQVLSRGSLAEMIQRPALDLYRKERQRQPLDEVVEGMRRDIRVQRVDGAPVAFRLSFEYPDRFKASSEVRELVAQFIECNIMLERRAGRQDSHAPGVFLMTVVKAPEVPQSPISPDHFGIAGMGFAAGVPLGLLIAFLRRRPPAEAWTALRFAAIAGAMGAAIGAIIAFAIPDHYVSTAVLRAKSPVSAQWIRELTGEALKAENLSAAARRRLRIQPLDQGVDGNPVSLSISYESADPHEAHETVQSLVSRFVEPTKAFHPPGAEPTSLEVLDAACTSQIASFPPRLPLAGGGLIAGVILGGIMQAARRKPYSAAA